MSSDVTDGRGVRLIRDKSTDICWVLDVSRCHIGASSCCLFQCSLSLNITNVSHELLSPDLTTWYEVGCDWCWDVSVKQSRTLDVKHTRFFFWSQTASMLLFQKPWGVLSGLIQRDFCSKGLLYLWLYMFLPTMMKHEISSSGKNPRETQDPQSKIRSCTRKWLGCAKYDWQRPMGTGWGESN